MLRVSFIFCFLSLVVCFFNNSVYCQLVTDISFRKDSVFYLINFRIKDCPTKKYYNVQLGASTDKGVYTPKCLMGDFQQVDCFGVKTIRWNNKIDSIQFSESDKIRIELVEVNRTPIIFNGELKYDKLVDVDKNTYNSIKIGNQVWMAENLRTTRFKNGDRLNQFLENNLWQENDKPTWVNYNFDTIFNSSYGKFYNWLAIIDKRGLCPSGWRIPKIGDWQQLIKYVGKFSPAALLKEVGTSKWKIPNAYSSNSYGFSATPSGFIDNENKFIKLGEQASWWSVSVYLNDYISTAHLNYSDDKFEINATQNSTGLSVRCIKE